nr:unnamed protein product [Callosobruchus chinensis]
MQSTTSPQPVVPSHEAKHQLQNLSAVNHRGHTSSTVTTQSCGDRGSSVQPPQIVQSRENSKYTEQEPGWKTVNYNKRKPRSHTIVGTGTLGTADVVCHLKAVPSLSYYHVYNLMPDTSREELLGYLKSMFKEVTCEQLESKYPHRYASFKVGVYYKNASDLLKPDIWPEGEKKSRKRVVNQESSNNDNDIYGSSIFHLNVQGLGNKSDELSIVLNDCDYDIVCLSEHWCTNEILNVVAVCNYKLISSFCRNVHVHGGVCMYARADVQCKAVDVKQYTREIHAEFCAVELSNKVVIITVYRSCAGDSEMFLQLFDRLLEDFSSSMRDGLENIDWSVFYNSTCVEFMANFLVTNCQALVNKNFPRRSTHPRRGSIVWYNEELRKQRDTLSTIKIISDSTGSPTFKAMYKSLHSNYKKSIISYKKQSYDNYIRESRNKSKDVWKLINSERSEQKININKNTNLSSTDFNNFFISIATEIIKDLSVDHNLQKKLLNRIPFVSNSFVLLPVHENDIREAIEYLKTSNSSDIYDLNILQIGIQMKHAPTPVALEDAAIAAVGYGSHEGQKGCLGAI